MPEDALKGSEGIWPEGHGSGMEPSLLASSGDAKGGALPPRQPGGPEEIVPMSRLRQTTRGGLRRPRTPRPCSRPSTMLICRRSWRCGKAIRMLSKKYGIKLGFMSFFAKACIAALQELPAVNAEIYGTDLIYKNYYNIGVAVGTENGLVVPVIRDADRMGFAQIESTIADFGKRARDGKLSMAEMSGGTFTISNGGIYGSMLSTPILNQPQSAILGMHRIEERPVAVNGEVVIRPMMYLALSYDHRIIDGREAVTFLVKVKENIEDPAGCCSSLVTINLELRAVQRLIEVSDQVFVQLQSDAQPHQTVGDADRPALLVAEHAMGGRGRVGHHGLAVPRLFEIRIRFGALMARRLRADRP